MILPVNGWEAGPYARREAFPGLAGAQFSLASAGDDHLYSVSAITDATGSIVERYGYDAYGDSVVLDEGGTAVAGNISTVGNPYLCTGRRFDDETGLSYFRARYYDTELGRFVGRDPHCRQVPLLRSEIPDDCYVYEDSFSFYEAAFVPNELDPTGMLSQKECDDCLDAAYSDLQVMALLNTIERAPNCNKPTIKCACDVSTSDYEDWTESTNHINIYGQNLDSCASVTMTLRHELIHAQQDCLLPQGEDEDDCTRVICEELAAVSGSGECNPGTMFSQRFYDQYPDDPAKARKECIVKRAGWSAWRHCRPTTANSDFWPKVRSKYNECATRF